MIVTFLKTGNISQDIIPHHINLSAVTTEDYHLIYDIIQKVKEEEFPALHLNSCQIEEELNKVSRLCLSNKIIIIQLKSIFCILTLSRRLLSGKWPLKCLWKSVLFQNSHSFSENIFSSIVKDCFNFKNYTGLATIIWNMNIRQEIFIIENEISLIAFLCSILYKIWLWLSFTYYMTVLTHEYMAILIILLHKSRLSLFS